MSPSPEPLTSLSGSVSPRPGAAPEPAAATDVLPTDLFAQNLRREREAQHVTQAELARRMEEWLGTTIGSTAILRIEQRTRAVRLDEAVAAARALGVPLVSLISEDPVRENEEAIQESLADLAVAEQEWEAARHRIDQTTRLIQQLSAERKQLIRDSSPSEADPSA